MSSLYELTSEFKAILDMAQDGEYSEDAIKDTLESIQLEIEDKADGYAKVIKTLEVDIAGLKVEEQRLAEKRKGIENKVKFMKKNLEDSMIETGNKKFKTLLFSFNVQKNAPSVDIQDETNIPREFYIEQQPMLDKRALLDHLKAGNVIEGVGIKQTESLRIR